MCLDSAYAGKSTCTTAFLKQSDTLHASILLIVVFFIDHYCAVVSNKNCLLSFFSLDTLNLHFAVFGHETAKLKHENFLHVYIYVLLFTKCKIVPIIQKDFGGSFYFP